MEEEANPQDAYARQVDTIERAVREMRTINLSTNMRNRKIADDAIDNIEESIEQIRRLLDKHA